MFVLVAALTLVVQAASPVDAFVKDVAFSSAGRNLEARITASESARFTYFELEGPHRLVVDFHGLRNGIAFTQKNIAAAGVTRVRTSYFTSPDRSATRIVFDLDTSVNYRVIDDGAGVVRVVFDTSRIPQPIDLPLPTNLVAGSPVISKEERTPLVPFVRLESLTPTTQVAQLEPPAVAVQTGAAAAAATTAATTASTAVQPAAAAEPAVQPAIVVTPARSPLPQEPGQQLSSRITVATQAQAPSITGPAQQQTFNGEPIDLDLKQADLGDFFRLISEISGLNVIVDQNVTGTTTVTLKDVPWDQALDIILRNHNLAGLLEGNVLRIATRSTLQAEDNARRAARDAALAAIPPVSKSYVLNYPKAADVATTLVNSRMLSQRGTVATEVRRNAIIVTDVEEQFDGIEKLIKFMDTPAQQVEIEARLLQANKSFSREFGSQLALLVGANNGNILTGGVGESSPFDRTPPPRVTVEGGSGLPLLTNFPAAATSGVAFLLQPGGDILLDAIITAAEASGNARLLSQPKVVTESNIRAEIEQGTRIPVQTNVNNTITTTYLTFALRLDVTPQVTEDGTIVMEVDIENSQPDLARTVSGIPVVSTQHAKTRRTVPDGATMMLGGIFLDTDSLNVRQVPGLGSIPVIGHLFKTTQTIKSQAELFFFITPRIKKADAVAAEAPRNN
jgi:type IV pilus assembly protein PilQ